MGLINLVLIIAILILIVKRKGGAPKSAEPIQKPLSPNPIRNQRRISVEETKELEQIDKKLEDMFEK